MKVTIVLLLCMQFQLHNHKLASGHFHSLMAYVWCSYSAARVDLGYKYSVGFVLVLVFPTISYHKT